VEKNGQLQPFIIGGVRGSGPGQLNLPTDMIFARQHCAFFVLEAYNQRVSAFDPRNGDFLFTFGTGGTTDGTFMAPSGIAVDMRDRLYVTDQAQHRISVWDPETNAAGKLSSYRYVRSWGSYGIDDGSFMYPQGIAIDDKDRVFVADFGNHRGQMYTLNGDFIRNFGLEELRPSGSFIDQLIVPPSGLQSPATGAPH
jgi:tripartite motif-containing protein 71